MELRIQLTSTLTRTINNTNTYRWDIAMIDLSTFQEWINEAATGQEADRHGKIHELLTGYHLNHLIHGEPAHMTHFRDKSGNSPSEAYHKLATGMSQEEMDHHNGRAAHAAKEIHEHLKTQHPEILHHDKSKGEHVRVTWTSQPGDHKNLTGLEDKAQQAGGADVMVSHHDKVGYVKHAVGYSLKYMSKSNGVTLSNRGMGSVEKQLNMPKGTLSKHDDEHDTRMTEHFKEPGAGARHKLYREIRNKKASGAKLTAKEAHTMEHVRNSDHKRTTAQAKALHDHLNSMSHAERTTHLRDMLAPEHTFPTYQVLTNSQNQSKPHIENNHEIVAKKLKEDYHLKHSGSYVHVIHKATGKTLAKFESRSKGRPAGGGAQFAPRITKEMEK